MYDSGDELEATLEQCGELHLILESGAEAHVHKRDTTISNGQVHIDSKQGEWAFSVTRVEDVEYPQSELHRP